MARIFIHIGLPKTATTTLQLNVFQNLVNTSFIGVKQPRIRDQHELYLKLKDAILLGNSLDEVRTLLISELEKGKNLLLSDELFSISDDNGSWIHKMERLSYIIHNLDYILIVTIRNPCKAMFSLYVELYKDFSKTNIPFINLALTNDTMKIYHYRYFFSQLYMIFPKGKIYVYSFNDIINGNISSLFLDLGENKKIDDFEINDNNAKKYGKKDVKIRREYTLFSFLLRNSAISIIVDYLQLKRFSSIINVFNLRIRREIVINKPDLMEMEKLCKELQDDIKFIKDNYKIDISN